MRIKINKIYLWLPVLFIVSSCYKAPEGCTDPNALNYDVVADVSCDNNCCNYPSVYIDFSFVYDTITIDTNSYFVNTSNDTFRISYLKFFLAGFTFYNDNDTIEVINPITLGIEENNDIVYKNINYPVAKININKKTFNTGTIKKRALFDNVYFSFGIDSTVNHAADISKLKSSHPLYQSVDSMHIDKIQGFYFLKMTIDGKNKSRDIAILGDENKLDIVLPGKYDFTKRENHTIKLKLDTKIWFKDIDLLNDEENLIIKNLMKNLKNSLKNT